MKQKYDIFISYRRLGGAQYARIIQLMLSQRGYKVFLDYDELTDGKFGEHIQEAIKNAPIFMLVLSKEALVRCKNEEDWVRREIQLAILEGKHIIPVNPDNSFDGIPADAPDDIKEEVGTHQHSDISFGQTLGVTVDYMVKKRIVPQIGERTRQDSDIDVLNQQLLAEDKARRRHRIFVKSIISLGVACALSIIGIVSYMIFYNNKEVQKREVLIKQVESHHPGLNFMDNDSITIEQLEVIDEIFNNLRDIKGDTLRFSKFETTVRQYHVILGEYYDKSKASLPIADVSFGKTQLFIMVLNGLINSDKTNIAFSLPTEEEWEYAASGGNPDNGMIYSGSNRADSVAWYQANSNGEAHPADGQSQLHPNAMGLYDMSGNVGEYVFTPFVDFSNPNTNNNSMIVKGGNFASPESGIMIKSRVPMEADISSPRVGFRLVLRKE